MRIVLTIDLPEDDTRYYTDRARALLETYIALLADDHKTLLDRGLADLRLGGDCLLEEVTR